MTDEPKISEKELADLNAAIDASKRRELDSERSKIEAEIREKIAAEAKLKAIEEANAKLAAELDASKKSQEEKESKLREEFTKQLEEIKAVRQGVANVQNPFDKPASSGINLRDESIQKLIEENSREAFLKKEKNLPHDWGKA